MSRFDNFPNSETEHWILNSKIYTSKEEYLEALRKEKEALDDADEREELRKDSWGAMTDGWYGDMPDNFDEDYSFLGE